MSLRSTRKSPGIRAKGSTLSGAKAEAQQQLWPYGRRHLPLIQFDETEDKADSRNRKLFTIADLDYIFDKLCLTQEVDHAAAASKLDLAIRHAITRQLNFDSRLAPKVDRTHFSQIAKIASALLIAVGYSKDEMSQWSSVSEGPSPVLLSFASELQYETEEPPGALAEEFEDASQTGGDRADGLRALPQTLADLESLALRAAGQAQAKSRRGRRPDYFEPTFFFGWALAVQFATGQLPIGRTQGFLPNQDELSALKKTAEVARRNLTRFGTPAADRGIDLLDQILKNNDDTLSRHIEAAAKLHRTIRKELAKAKTSVG